MKKLRKILTSSSLLLLILNGLTGCISNKLNSQPKAANSDSPELPAINSPTLANKLLMTRIWEKITSGNLSYLQDKIPPDGPAPQKTYYVVTSVTYDVSSDSYTEITLHDVFDKKQDADASAKSRQDCSADENSINKNSKRVFVIPVLSDGSILSVPEFEMTYLCSSSFQ